MIIGAFVKPKQHILIHEIPKGRVIDIGGGGEGVIAQVGGDNIIAIDKYLSEIRETKDKAPDVTWIVTDGAELPFPNESFDNATAFFSCMYMSEDVKRKIFQETRRILKNGGEFWIWDVNMSPKSKVFAIRLKAEIPENRTITTVYGVKTKDQSAATICGQLQEAGFVPELITNHKHWFFTKATRV